MSTVIDAIIEVLTNHQKQFNLLIEFLKTQDKEIVKLKKQVKKLNKLV